MSESVVQYGSWNRWYATPTVDNLGEGDAAWIGKWSLTFDVDGTLWVQRYDPIYRGRQLLARSSMCRIERINGELVITPTHSGIRFNQHKIVPMVRHEYEQVVGIRDPGKWQFIMKSPAESVAMAFSIACVIVFIAFLLALVFTGRLS